MRTEDMYYNEQKRSEVMEAARRLRRKFLRYQQAEIVYSLSHKKLMELANEAGAIYRMDGIVLINKKRRISMHSKVWMFSHLIDDEDLAFLQREFVSYQQAMDYYGLGYKPVVRLSHISGSVYKIGKKVLIRRSIFEEYLRNHVKRGTEEWEELLR